MEKVVHEFVSNSRKYDSQVVSSQGALAWGPIKLLFKAVILDDSLNFVGILLWSVYTRLTVVKTCKAFYPAINRNDIKAKRA